MKKSFYLAAVLFGILLLILPVSSSHVNLTQPYTVSTFAITRTEMGINSGVNPGTNPWNTAGSNSAIVWIEFYEMSTNGVVNFDLIFNDQTTISGSIQAQDDSPISGTVTVDLAGVTKTNTYSHIPLLGAAPPQILSYGVDASGYHYLSLLPANRVGGYSPSNSIPIVNPLNGKPIVDPVPSSGYDLDTSVDPYVLINPPVINPIIQIGYSSSSLSHFGQSVGFGGGYAGGRSGDSPPSLEVSSVSLIVYNATMENLQNGGKKSGTDWIALFTSSIGGALGILLFSVGFVVSNAQYIPLAMLLGESLLFLHYLEKKQDILVALGLFFEKNLYFADIAQRILSYVIDALFKAWEAFLKWL